MRTSSRPSSSAKNGFPPDVSLNARELRPRQLQPEPLPQQMVKRAQAQRAEPEPLQPLVWERALELERRGDLGQLAQSRKQADPLVAQSPQRDLQHRGRGRVEPLDIVERDDHGALLREHAQHIE